MAESVAVTFSRRVLPASAPITMWSSVPSRLETTEAAPTSLQLGEQRCHCSVYVVVAALVIAQLPRCPVSVVTPSTVTELTVGTALLSGGKVAWVVTGDVFALVTVNAEYVPGEATAATPARTTSARAARLMRRATPSAGRRRAAGRPAAR
jgi:hypothetical protein